MDRDIVSRHNKYLFPALSTYYQEPMVIERAEGLQVWDQRGRQYLDFFGGILTVSVGHCDPQITETTHSQMQKLQHTSTLYVTEPQVRLAEKLADITPGPLTRSFFTNSGTEANETAVVLAGQHTKRGEVIALRHSYSGRSMLAMSLSAQHPWRLTESSLGGIKHAHSPYCYRCGLGLQYPGCNLQCARDIEELIQTTTSGQISAFIAEPIQGVGGFITPPPEYFEVVLQIVREYGGVFICDEVQTGFGRTGQHWFGIQHWGVQPDIITCAKGMGNGAPVAATITTDEIAHSLHGSTISTFGGNPVSSTAALATVEAIESRQLLQRASEMGGRLRDGLDDICSRYVAVGDVRGMGLMQGVEIVRQDGSPASDLADMVLEGAKDRRLLVGKGGLHGNTLRIAPPLSVTPEQVDCALQTLEETIADLPV